MASEYISPQTLLAEMRSAHPPLVIDVRGLDEYIAGHIPGARHIPFEELAERLEEIPLERAVVPY